MTSSLPDSSSESSLAQENAEVQRRNCDAWQGQETGSPFKTGGWTDESIKHIPATKVGTMHEQDKLMRACNSYKLREQLSTKIF